VTRCFRITKQIGMLTTGLPGRVCIALSLSMHCLSSTSASFSLLAAMTAVATVALRGYKSACQLFLRLLQQ
jgi:hypothetical protein